MGASREVTEGTFWSRATQKRACAVFVLLTIIAAPVLAQKKEDTEVTATARANLLLSELNNKSPTNKSNG
jgi:hypothetical protein